MTTVSTVSAVVERVDYLLLAEGAPARCEGELRDGIVQLHSELHRIEKLLSEADAKNNISGDVKKQVTELSYEIEDAIESYATSKGKSGVFRRSSKTKTRLREDIQIFNRRIDKLKHLIGDVATVGTSEISSSNTTTTAAADRSHRQLVQTTSFTNHVPVVGGLEEDAVRLKSVLTDGEPKLSLVAICGMGGVGKTTLTRLIYHDNFVVERFDCRAWVTVGPEFQARDILETILFSLSSTHSKFATTHSKDEIANMETMELMLLFHRSLSGRRYVVVLDDVWSIEAWYTINIAFPDDHNGSRVIITTRLQNDAVRVARYVHEVKMMTEEESWELFKLRHGEQDLGEIERIGKEIVRQCRGLPLAINAIGSLLKGKKFEDWEAALHRLQRIQNPEPVQEMLALSYNYLPFHLKPCFLYLGHFPPDQAIPLEKLFLLWTAEGLISTKALNDKRRMEIAEDYLKELVDRCLVIMVENEQVSANRMNQSYQVHDLIRDLCITQGKKEDFLEIIDFGHGNKISTLTRRVSIYLDKFKDRNEVFINIPEAKHIRSILFFDTDLSLPNPTWPREFIDLKEFQWTRLLHFDGVDFRAKKLPRGIEKLVYLRYLSFQECYLQELPSSLSNFQFLETLDLRVRVSCIMTIPNILRNLSSLRHLYFPKAFRRDTKDKLKLDGLRKLEILANFHAGICDANDLLQLQNLQILTGIVDGNTMDLDKTISSLNGNKNSCKSSLVVKNLDSYSEGRFSIMEELFKCNALHSLDIEGYLGKLPRHDAIGSNFREMVFNGSEFNEDPMPILGKLHNLESLVLCNDAFVGKKMTCFEAGDFLRLTSLKLATLQYLEEWEVDSAAMPCLTILTIEQCDELIKLPNELIQILTLEKFLIGSMPEGFQEKVKGLIEEATSFGNDHINATFYDC